MTDQMMYCVRPTSPIPRILPSISSVGRTEAMITSTIRLVFSSITPRRFWNPYMKKVVYMRTMKMIAAKIPAPFSSFEPFSVTFSVFKSTRFSSSVESSGGRPRSSIFSFNRT